MTHTDIINDIRCAERYDTELLAEADELCRMIMEGRLDSSALDPDTTMDLLVLTYANDLANSGRAFDKKLGLNVSDDEDLSFGAALLGAVIGARGSTGLTEDESADSLLKKVASYIYVRAYNRFRAEGTLMSVYIDPDERILNVLDPDTENVYSIDAMDLALGILGGFFNQEGDTVEQGEDGITIMLPLFDIDGLLTEKLGEHEPEVPDCRVIEYGGAVS